MLFLACLIPTNSVPDYPAETWAVAAPKRTFAAPIAVGTIDQALLSILRSRHAWMRAAFLSRHLLVVDEVHASDPYMATLTRGLIERHLSLGGRALAMSATLGETALAILMDRERRPIDAAISVPYPAIRRSGGDDALPEAPGRTIDVVIEGYEQAAARARVAAAEGQCVLWLRSTVVGRHARFLDIRDARRKLSASPQPLCSRGSNVARPTAPRHIWRRGTTHRYRCGHDPNRRAVARY